MTVGRVIVDSRVGPRFDDVVWYTVVIGAILLGFTLSVVWWGVIAWVSTMSIGYYFAMMNHFLKTDRERQRRFVAAAVLATLSLGVLIAGYGVPFLLLCAAAVLLAKTSYNLSPKYWLSEING
jgi:hypothetical protein